MSLKRFLNDIYDKKCNRDTLYTEALVSDIEISVKELVWRMVNKAHELEFKDIYKVSDKPINFQGAVKDIFPIVKLIPVGSFYEETKVGNPFEFDFMLNIDLSDLIIEPGCAPGLAKIKCTESCKWADFALDGYLKVEADDFESCPGIYDIFSTMFEKLTKEDSVHLTEAERTIEKPSGTLKCMPSGYVHFAFLWSPMDGEDHMISVDSMPAFSCPDEFIVRSAESGAFDGQFLELVLERKCYLVPKPCINPGCTTCFHITYATSENHLMKQMDDHHKKCYMILKHLVVLKSEYEDNLTDVSSYKLKTCLFHHVYASPDGCTSTDIEDCTLNILQRLVVCYDSMNLPRFFQRNTSLFVKSEYSISYLDVLVKTKQTCEPLIVQNVEEKQSLTNAFNLIAWFELTKSILLITREILGGMKSKSERYEFVKAYDFFEDVMHILDFHFSTSAALILKHNRFIDKLMEQKDIKSELFIPILSLLSKHFPQDALQMLEVEGSLNITTPLPLHKLSGNISSNELDKVRQEIESSAGSIGHRFFVYLVSGWFVLYDGHDFVTRKCQGEELNCVALTHRTFWEELD